MSVFKAYDIRGIYPEELDESKAYLIGKAFVELLKKDGLNVKSVVVSRDDRKSSGSLSDALAKGIISQGVEVKYIGLSTTPMNYFAINKLKADGGIQVTASHNPPQYNGFKLSRKEARPISKDTGIDFIEQLTLKWLKDNKVTIDSDDLTLRPIYIKDQYFNWLLSFANTQGRKLKVVVDAANGMGVLYRDLFESLDIDFIPLFFELDCSFPNHEPNPLKEENLKWLQQKVLEENADLGVAFDGDADRAAFVDEKGEIVRNDITTALLAAYLLENNKGRVVVYDLRSSRVVPEYIKKMGGIPIKERVGHSFIKKTMREKKAIMGGELAGHYYFADSFYADSAILAVIHMLNLLKSKNANLSEIASPLKKYYKTPEINFKIDNKDQVISELAKTFKDGQISFLDGITVEYEDWWFNVRPSNTEPLVRLVAEGKEEKFLKKKLEKLFDVLGVPE